MAKTTTPSAIAKNSNDGETEKRVLFNGMPEDDEQGQCQVWSVLPESDIVSFRLETLLPWEDDAKDHPYNSPCDLRTVVIRVAEGKKMEFQQHFEDHFLAAGYCEFLLGLVVKGPVSKNVQIWQFSNHTMVIIENEMIIHMEVVNKPTSMESKTTNR